MFAQSELMSPYFQNFCHEFQPLDDFCYSQKQSSSLDSIITSSSVSDYDFGGDLFKVPEAIIEEPISQLDPLMTAALAMMSCDDDVMPSSGLSIDDMESMQNEQRFCDVFDGFKKELLDQTSIETSEVQIDENKALPDLPFAKSESSGSLSSLEWGSGANVRPNFLDFPEMDFRDGYAMRRAFSEGDMKTLGKGTSINLVCSPIQQTLSISSCTSEDRLQKLSRYRNKKARRNFGRKIKYACRKALADSQLRVRGRFAKTEDTDSLKKK